MHFQLRTVPTTDPTTVADELRRFITNTGRFGLSTVVVQPPYAQRPLHLWLIEVPDPVADWVEDRLFPIVLGPAYPVKRTGPVAPRPEWTGHVLVLPTAAAAALAPLLLTSWTSACLQVRWTPGRCGALLHYSADDTARLDEIRALGWQIVPLASLLTRAVRQPVITRRSPVLPLLSSAAASMPAPTSAPTAQSTPAQGHVAAPTLGTAPDPAGLPSALAGPGEPGFLLGVTPEDVGVKLAWRAIACAVDGPGPRQRAAFLALLRRAFAQGMGIVAIVPRGLISDGALEPWAGRIRVLDGARNPIESAAIPWQRIPPTALSRVFARLAIATSLPEPLPSEFGALLQQCDAADLCTQPVLIQTARPGDDLLGVLAQGGGVVLVDTDDAGSDLLGSLLLELCAQDALGDRPLLLVRPARLPVPAALADRCLQLVLGRSAAASATLTAQPGHWLLRDAQGELRLEEDLSRTPSEIADGDHLALVTTLVGPQDTLLGPSTQTNEEPALSTTIHAPTPVAHTPLLAVTLQPEPAADAEAGPILPPATATTAADLVVAAQALPRDQPVVDSAAPVPPAAEVIAPEDWAESLEAVISDLDPVVTELPTLTLPTLPLGAAAAPPVSTAAESFDWGSLTKDVTATLNGDGVAAQDAGAASPAPVTADAAADPHELDMEMTMETTTDPLPPVDHMIPDLPPDDRRIVAPAALRMDGEQSDTHDPSVGSPLDHAALPDVLPLTLAPLDGWDVQITLDDHDPLADEPARSGDAPIAASAGGLDGVTPAAPRREPAALWLRPARRGWAPGSTTKQAAAQPAGRADRPAQPAAAQDGLNTEQSHDLPAAEDDRHAALPLLPEHPALTLPQALDDALPGQEVRMAGTVPDGVALPGDFPTDDAAVPDAALLLPPGVPAPDAAAQAIEANDPAQDGLNDAAAEADQAYAALPDLTLLVATVAAQDQFDTDVAQAQHEERVLPDRAAQADQAHAALPDLPALAHDAATQDRLDAGAAQANHAVLALPDGAAQAPSDRDLAAAAQAVDASTDGALPVMTLGSSMPAVDLPGASDPIAPVPRRVWPDVDRAAITVAWRAGLTVPALVQQLQGEYPEVDAQALRRRIREIIQQALMTPAAVTQEPAQAAQPPTLEPPRIPAQASGVLPSADRSAIPALPGSTDSALPLVALLAPALPAQDQPLALGSSTLPVIPAAQADGESRPAQMVVLSPTATDAEIWAAWQAGMDLKTMIGALAGLSPRSTAGQAARDRIHQVVVPRIVAELKVEAVVARFLAREPLLPEDGERYELLLQRMNRQGHPATGPIRTKTEQRLRAVMQPRVALAPTLAQEA